MSKFTAENAYYLHWFCLRLQHCKSLLSAFPYRLYRGLPLAFLTDLLIAAYPTLFPFIWHPPITGIFLPLKRWTSCCFSFFKKKLSSRDLSHEESFFLKKERDRSLPPLLSEPPLLRILSRNLRKDDIVRWTLLQLKKHEKRGRKWEGGLHYEILSRCSKRHFTPSYVALVKAIRRSIIYKPCWMSVCQ